jgi:hypothetical protein
VLYALFDRSGDRRALQQALTAYRKARAAWADLAACAHDVYAPDITFGLDKHLRGHWQDRLPALDEDLADMAKRLAAAPVDSPSANAVDKKLLERAIQAVLSPAPRPHLICEHTAPAQFRPGQGLVIELATGEVERRRQPLTVHLRYRRVNQAEPWLALKMEAQGRDHRATIPGDYTKSPFPLQYYFELRDALGRAWLHPGFNADLSNQPYFVVRRTTRWTEHDVYWACAPALHSLQEATRANRLG